MKNCVFYLCYKYIITILKLSHKNCHILKCDRKMHFALMIFLYMIYIIIIICQIIEKNFNNFKNNFEILKKNCHV